jgi:hypothetical protein
MHPIRHPKSWWCLDSRRLKEGLKLNQGGPVLQGKFPHNIGKPTNFRVPEIPILANLVER